MALHSAVVHPVSALQEFSGAYTCGSCHAQAEDPVKCNYPVLLCKSCTQSFARTDPPQEFAPPGGYFPQEAMEAQAKRGAYQMPHFERGDTKTFVIEKKADIALILTQGLESLGKVEELQKEVEELKRKLDMTRGKLDQSIQDADSLRKSGSGGGVIGMTEMHKLMDELRNLSIASQKQGFDFQQQIESQRAQLDALRQENSSQREDIARLKQTVEDAEKRIAEKDQLLNLKDSLLEGFKNQLNEVSGIYAEVIPILTHMRSASKECFDVFMGKVGLVDCLKAKEALKTTELCVRLAELAGPDANHKVLCKVMFGSVANNPEKLKRFQPHLITIYEKMSEIPDRAKDAARAIIARMETETFEESLKAFTDKSKELTGSAFCGFALSYFSAGDVLSHELYALAAEKKIADSDFFLKTCETFREAACSIHVEKVKTLENIWEGCIRNASEKEVKSASELITLMLQGKNTNAEVVEMLTAFIPLLSQELSDVVSYLLLALRRISIAESRASFGFGVMKWLFEAGRVRADITIGKERLNELSIAESNFLLSSADLVGQVMGHGLEFVKSCELNQLLKCKGQAHSVSDFITYFKVFLDQRHAFPSSGSEWIRLCFSCIDFDKYRLAFLAVKTFALMIGMKGKASDAEEFSRELLEAVGPIGVCKDIDLLECDEALLSLGELIVRARENLDDIPLLPFIKAILMRMQEKKEYKEMCELMRETLELFADGGMRHTLVVKLCCCYRERDSVSSLRNYWKVLKSMNHRSQTSLENTIDILKGAAERVVQGPLTIQELEELFAMAERASRCTVQEATCFVEMLEPTKLKQSLFVANQLLVLKKTLLDRGLEDSVLTDERAEELKQAIKNATKSEEEMRDPLSGVVNLATQLLDPVRLYRCTPNHIIDFARHVLSHAFSNPYPLRLLTNLRDQRVLENFKQFLAKQISPVPVQMLFSFVAGGMVYVEPGRMKYFNFQTEQWNAWITVRPEIKVDFRGKYVFLEDDKLFCCGGWSGSASYNNTYLITPTGETRELATMKTARRHHGLIYLADRRTVYTFGGGSTC